MGLAQSSAWLDLAYEGLWPRQEDLVASVCCGWMCSSFCAVELTKSQPGESLLLLVVQRPKSLSVPVHIYA